MSDKLYQKIYSDMSEPEKDAMFNLYMGGTNRDGHTYVTFGNVEHAAAIIHQESYKKALDDVIAICKRSINHEIAMFAGVVEDLKSKDREESEDNFCAGCEYQGQILCERPKGHECPRDEKGGAE